MKKQKTKHPKKKANRRKPPTPPAAVEAPAVHVPLPPADWQSSKQLEGKPATSAGEIAQTFLDRMDQMRIDAATRRERIEARLVMELQSLPCPNRGIPHQLDREGTVLASWKTDDLVLVYRPCGICQGAADIVDKSSWLHKAGVPSIMLGCCIETWKPDTSAHHRVARAVREWAAHPKGFLVITGKPGVGKTHLAISAMKLVRHGRLITQTNFLAGIRKRYAEPGAPDVLAQLKVRKFLVFDELGHGTGARDEYSNVYELLDYRHGEGLPTIVTTNSAPEDFTQDLGDRLADRLAAHQPFLCIHGESWRGR